MVPTTVFGFCGGIASGKSEAGKVALEMGYHVYETSDVLRAELRKEGVMQPDRHQCIQKAHALVDTHGLGILGTLAAETIRNEAPRSAVICGLRNPEQLEAIRKLYRDATFIYLRIDEISQLERARLRSGEETLNPLLAKQILEEAHPLGNTSMHLPHTERACHVSINTSLYTLDAFRKQIRTLLSP